MVEQEYASIGAARAADAVGERRWIPDILPDDAVAIHEVHNIDTNQTWGCFKTQKLGTVRGSLAVLKAVEVRSPIDLGPRATFRGFSWWPNRMRSTSVEAAEFREPPLAPAIQGFAVRVGIDSATGTVCYHRSP